VIESLLRKHLAGQRAERVLDIGPGYNAFGRIACRVTGAAHLTIVDVDRRVLDWQRDESRKVGIDLHPIEAALEPDQLSAALDELYDVILCQEIFEHLTNAEEVLAVLVARLRPGGRMVITVPTAISERWLRWLNPSYMENVPFGHVRRFHEDDLRRLAAGAGLHVLALVPTQPHYFLTHTWTFGLRMVVEESTGRVVSKGWRAACAAAINAYGRAFFMRTGPEFWGRLLPRNYFLVAGR
jgi:2-polyprenyl-3-methyl-5-hydroxy-6-metoxy-1,4-benzoquinol methylase